MCLQVMPGAIDFLPMPSLYQQVIAMATMERKRDAVIAIC